MLIFRYITTVTALIFITLINGCANAQTAGSTTERNRQFIVQAFEQWAAGNGTFFQDVLSPDVVWIIKGTSPAAGTYRGRDAFMEQAVAPFAARLAAPVRPTVKDVWAEGDDVIVHWNGTATAADGEPYHNSYVWIFRMENQRATEVIAFLDLVPYDDVIKRISIEQQGKTQMDEHPYIGMWVTDDGHIRHELLANGRYDEARGSRESAYQGRYEVKGKHIDYWDDTGFTADGVFIDENTLHHGGMVFRRQG